MSAKHTAAPQSTTERRLARAVTLPAPAPGFIGEGHTAIHVIDAREFAHNDPFILLADDLVDIPPGQRAGGPHPHAGFEIVTFVVEGELRDRDEGLLRAGDVAWMTAGSGVVHGEDLEPLGKVRILQLWVTLPSANALGRAAVRAPRPRSRAGSPGAGCRGARLQRDVRAGERWVAYLSAADAGRRPVGSPRGVRTGLARDA